MVTIAEENNMLKCQKHSMISKDTNAVHFPYFNTGTMYDLAVGRFVPGKNGTHILNGGLSSVNSIAGKEQTFKTSIALGYAGRVVKNYPFLEELVYDSENSLNGVDRLAVLAGCTTDEETNSFVERVEYKNRDDYFLEDFYDRIISIADERKKHKNDYIEETPFLDRYGKNIRAWVPMVIANDSFSAASVKIVGDLIKKDGIAGAKTTTDNMKDGLIKTRFFSQIPAIASQAGIMFVFTGHIGGDSSMDPASKFRKQLPMMKMNEKVKNVGTKFTFLSNNLLETRNVKVLRNQSDKGCEYPTNVNSDIELQLIKSIVCRCKNNASGSMVEHISSQYFGIQEHLEHFHYVRERSAMLGARGRYSIPGLDVNFTRKTVRDKITESYETRRMLDIIGQYLYIHDNWNLPEFQLIEPEAFVEMITNSSKDLITDIVNSTGIWTYTSVKQDRPYMSVIDIVNKLAKEIKK